MLISVTGAGIVSNRNEQQACEAEEASEMPDGYWKDRLLQLFADVVWDGPSAIEIEAEAEMEIVQFALPGIFA